jgi:16S rRNA (guanine527-N7)-methyltransferase
VGEPAVPESDAAPPAPGRVIRPELPADPWLLEPMGAAFDEALEAGLAELGLEPSRATSSPARRSYEAHARLLRAWGAAINLTSIRGPAEVARRHVVDSLSAVRLLEALGRPPASLLDLGSGSGYPGLPLAAALPLARVALLDSVGKKARFLGVAGSAVLASLQDGGWDPRIEAIAERAEDLAEEPDEREHWDVVTARAVGALAEVLELALPLVRVGGHVVAWKREEEHGGLLAELRAAGSIIRAAGGGRPAVHVVDAPSLPGHRLVVVPKDRPTPGGFPRPAGIRRRRTGTAARGRTSGSDDPGV